MKKTDERELRRRFSSQHGLVSRSDLRALGVDSRHELARVRAGEWELVGRRVLRLAGSPRTPEQSLLAACLEAGPTAMASHQSALWLWGLHRLPDRQAITVGRKVSMERSLRRWVDVHHPIDLPQHVSLQRGIPCTNPLRALVDFAAVGTDEDLDSAVDRGLASQLITVEGLLLELGRLGRRGRRGVGRLRNALARRGMQGSPDPSVLESRLLRMLGRYGITPLGVEVRVGEGGRYRVDVLLAPDLVVEVDGYAYHHSPEQKAEDERRRNQLRLQGMFILVYTWRDIVHDERRVIREVRQALAARRSA